MLNQTEKLLKTEKYVAEKLQKDTTGHDFEHIKRVVNLTEKIMFQEADSALYFICKMGALLHDVIDDKVVENVLSAKKDLALFLTTIEVSPEDSRAIFEIIENLSFKKQLDNPEIELSFATQIVQDADRLDAIGAIGVARTFYYGGNKGSKMYDSGIQPRENLNSKAYRNNESSVINHFYEKLLQLSAGLNTETARELAVPREEFMKSFLKEFLAEYRGEI